MTIELTSLVLTAALSLALTLVYTAIYSKQVGSAGLTSNREETPAPTGAAARGLRAHRNLIENLVPFAIVVLTAHVLSISSTVTVWCAIAFPIARFIHAVSYVAGITGVRTFAWNVGLLVTVVYLVDLFI